MRSNEEAKFDPFPLDPLSETPTKSRFSFLVNVMVAWAFDVLSWGIVWTDRLSKSKSSRRVIGLKISIISLTDAEGHVFTGSPRYGTVWGRLHVVTLQQAWLWLAPRFSVEPCNATWSTLLWLWCHSVWKPDAWDNKKQAKVAATLATARNSEHPSRRTSAGAATSARGNSQNWRGHSRPHGTCHTRKAEQSEEI